MRLLIFLACLTPVLAAALPSDSAAQARWEKRGSSLLYFDRTGNLSSEIGLGNWEDASSGGLTIRRVSGGVAGEGGYAWSFEQVSSWNTTKTRLLSSTGLLTFYGSRGKPLWTSDEAYPPETGDPIALSRKGEVLIMSLKAARGNVCVITDFLGGRLLTTEPFSTILSLSMTAQGRYALIRWAEPDKSDTHTIIEVRTKKRQDIPSTEFSLGEARVTDGGKVFAGKRLVYEFHKTAAAPEAR